jgi:hypothetical protein
MLMIHILRECFPFLGGILAGALLGLTTCRVRPGAWGLMMASLLVGTAASLVAGEVGHDFVTSAICVAWDTFAALLAMAAALLLLRQREASR